MLSETGARRAHELLRMVDAGTLPAIRRSDVAHGSTDTLAPAVGVLFAELDRLAHDDPTTPDGRARWRAAEAEATRLWRRATGWAPRTGRMTLPPRG